MEYEEEDLVTIETAKLARDKDFDWNTCNYWMRVSLKRNPDGWEEDYDEETNWNNDDDTLSRPLQMQLQKWLRSVHGIEVSARPVIYTGDARASYYTPMVNESTHDYRNKYKTYEEALEVALYAGLELVK